MKANIKQNPSCSIHRNHRKEYKIHSGYIFINQAYKVRARIFFYWPYHTLTCCGWFDLPGQDRTFSASAKSNRDSELFESILNDVMKQIFDYDVNLRNGDRSYAIEEIHKILESVCKEKLIRLDING